MTVMASYLLGIMFGSAVLGTAYALICLMGDDGR